jgi:hypothetical protein
VNQVVADAGEDQQIEQGQSVKLIADGGDSYLWSNGARTQSIVVSPSESRAYSVTTFVSECSDTDEVFVEVVSSSTDSGPINLNAGEDQTICTGQSIILKATGGDSYEWSTGEKSSEIVVNPTRTTTYSVTADTNGFIDTDSVTVIVENCENSVSQNLNLDEINIYPNPTEGLLTLNIEELSIDELDIQLIHVNGGIMIQDKIYTSRDRINKKLDMSSLEKGIYFLRLFSKEENYVQKIVLI